MLIIVLLCLLFAAPARGVELPQWYSFFANKLCIAVPMIFILAGFIREKRKSLNTLLKRKRKSAAPLDISRKRTRWLDSLLGFFALLRLSYVLFGVTGYFFVQLIPENYISVQTLGAGLLKDLIYPLIHPIGFLWILPALLISRLVAAIIHALEKHFFPTIFSKETYFVSFLWMLFAVAFVLRIIVNTYPLAPEKNILAWQEATANWVYYVGGMLLYRYYPQLRKKKVRLAILLLFHVTLFTRLLAPIPVALSPVINTVYSAFLAILYFLLAFRGAALIKSQIAKAMGIYAEGIAIVGWFVMATLWQLYGAIPNSAFAISITILLIAAAGLLFPTLFLRLLISYFPALVPPKERYNIKGSDQFVPSQRG